MQYNIILATEILIAGVVMPELFLELSTILLVTNYLKKYQLSYVIGSTIQQKKNK